MRFDLRAVASRALGEDAASASVEKRTAIEYDVFLAGRGVDRVVGVAESADGRKRNWSAIVKHTRLAGLTAGRRELVAYRSGVADSGADSALRAPRLLGFEEGPDHVELWLEELRDEHAGNWPVFRYGVAARHIASRNAALMHNPVRGLDPRGGWGESHGQPHRIPEVVSRLDELRSAPQVEELMRLLDDDGFVRTKSMVERTPARLSRLAAYPQVVLHHDLVRSNLFALSTETTGAIDWENVGLGPLGVDLAPLVDGSVRRGEASGDDLSELREACLRAYESGLSEAGVDPSGVRDAYDLAVALRWHVVLGAITAWLDPTVFRMRGTKPHEPREEGLHHLTALARHLLEAADRTG
jgi:hypothetical protein